MKVGSVLLILLFTTNITKTSELTSLKEQFLSLNLNMEDLIDKNAVCVLNKSTDNYTYVFTCMDAKKIPYCEAKAGVSNSLVKFYIPNLHIPVSLVCCTAKTINQGMSATKVEYMPLINDRSVVLFKDRSNLFLKSVEMLLGF